MIIQYLINSILWYINFKNWFNAEIWCNNEVPDTVPWRSYNFLSPFYSLPMLSSHYKGWMSTYHFSASLAVRLGHSYSQKDKAELCVCVCKITTYTHTHGIWYSPGWNRWCFEGRTLTSFLLWTLLFEDVKEIQY